MYNLVTGSQKRIVTKINHKPKTLQNSPGDGMMVGLVGLLCPNLVFSLSLDKIKQYDINIQISTVSLSKLNSKDTRALTGLSKEKRRW